MAWSADFRVEIDASSEDYHSANIRQCLNQTGSKLTVVLHAERLLCDRPVKARVKALRPMLGGRFEPSSPVGGPPEGGDGSGGNRQAKRYGGTLLLGAEKKRIRIVEFIPNDGRPESGESSGGSRREERILMLL